MSDKIQLEKFKKGAIVRFTNYSKKQVTYGDNDDPLLYLNSKTDYEVEKAFFLENLTKIKLKGFDFLFNSVHFSMKN